MAWSLDIIWCGRLVRYAGGDMCLKTYKCWQGWGEIKSFAHFNGNSECWSYYRKQYENSQKYIETTLMVRWIFKENMRHIFVYIYVCVCVCVFMGFSGSTSGKEPTCQDRRYKRCGFNPIRKIPWKRVWQPPAIFLSGESHGQRSLAGYSS